MIAQDQVDEVCRLLATGEHSHRAIAEKTGVSRGTVGTIARGERKDYVPSKNKRYQNPFDGPIERCPGCGGRVRMPCLACETQKAKKRSEWNDPKPIDDDFSKGSLQNSSFGLKLEGEHRQAYEEVRRQRRFKEWLQDPRDRREDDCERKVYDASIFSQECLECME